MSKIIVSNLMSLDGYYEGPGKNVDAIWKFHHSDYANDMSFHYYNMELFRNSKFLLLGKDTFFERFNEHWRNVLKDPKARNIERELANLIVPLEKIVISNTLAAKDLSPEDNVRILKREEVYKALIDLKQRPGKNITIIGSRKLWQDLLAYDLIDEIHLTIAPVFSGTGTPLFDHQPEIYLKRIDTRIASGNITVIFQVSRKKT